jgi:hypothetical protein
MDLPDQRGTWEENGTSRCPAGGLEETVWSPSAGAYLTDGAALFHVAYTICDGASGELYLELEDCSTLEVVLYPARVVAGSGLRSVTPAPAA